MPSWVEAKNKMGGGGGSGIATLPDFWEICLSSKWVTFDKIATELPKFWIKKCPNFTISEKIEGSYMPPASYAYLRAIIPNTYNSVSFLDAYLKIDIRKDEFMVARINHSWPIRTGKNINSWERTKCPQRCWLSTKCDFLLLWQQTLKYQQFKKNLIDYFSKVLNNYCLKEKHETTKCL